MISHSNSIWGLYIAVYIIFCVVRRRLCTLLVYCDIAGACFRAETPFITEDLRKGVLPGQLRFIVLAEIFAAAKFSILTKIFLLRHPNFDRFFDFAAPDSRNPDDITPCSLPLAGGSCILFQTPGGGPPD